MTYAISTAETTKGTDPGEVAMILFDEFITRQFYIANEFIKFQNLLSSIIRDRPNVQIYMLANTVSKHCPYFRDMGLYRISQQEQGTIDVYTMGKSGTKIAVEGRIQTGSYTNKDGQKVYTTDVIVDVKRRLGTLMRPIVNSVLVLPVSLAEQQGLSALALTATFVSCVLLSDTARTMMSSPGRKSSAMT